MANEQVIHTTHLSNTQMQVMLAIFLADTPQEALNISRRNVKAAEAVKVLIQMDFVVIGENGAAVTKTGIRELINTGYIDEAGQTTELGQQFYQQAVAALNEKISYELIGELLRSK